MSSREAHQRVINALHVQLMMLRADVRRTRDDSYRDAAMLAVEAVGLPESVEAPGGALVQSLAAVREHLDELMRLIDQSRSDLQTYEKGI